MTTESKPITKKTQLIKMLSMAPGADIETVCNELGWLPHTARSAISGLRKDGHEVATEKPGNNMALRYRIVSGQ